MTIGGFVRFVAGDVIGTQGTLEAFNKALGRSVRRRTDREKGGFEQKDHGFEKARNHWFEKGTTGRRFIEEVIEPRRGKARPGWPRATRGFRYAGVSLTTTLPIFDDHRPPQRRRGG
jgi:hypothetical protein